MFKLFRSFSRDSGQKGALPPVYSTFEKQGIGLYRGELAMWAGPPGAGKSALALNYALKAKVPTLYVSCDMGPQSVMNRVAAIEAGVTVAEARANPEKYRGVIESVDHMYVTYPSRPDAEAIARAQQAFIEVHGLPSDLMVIDNLMNLNSGAKDEYTGFRDLSQVFHYLGTELEISVLLLHHINLGGIDLTVPGPLNAIKGQVTELPGLVMTFAKREGQLLGAAVKNRQGRADASGRTYVTLDYDEEKQIISDQVAIPTPPVSIPRRKAPVEIPDWFARGVKD
jgi:hypothetical protein